MNRSTFLKLLLAIPGVGLVAKKLHAKHPDFSPYTITFSTESPKDFKFSTANYLPFTENMRLEYKGHRKCWLLNNKGELLRTYENYSFGEIMSELPKDSVIHFSAGDFNPKLPNDWVDWKNIGYRDGNGKIKPLS